MISDVLFSALRDIETYERELPHVYGDPYMKGRIATVKAAMNSLRIELDTPPQYPATKENDYE